MKIVIDLHTERENFRGASAADREFTWLAFTATKKKRNFMDGFQSNKEEGGSWMAFEATKNRRVNEGPPQPQGKSVSMSIDGFYSDTLKEG